MKLHVFTVYFLILLATVHCIFCPYFMPTGRSSSVCRTSRSSCVNLTAADLPEYFASKGDVRTPLLAICFMPELINIETGVFASVKYETLVIEGTGLASVDDDAFQGSKDIVSSITISGYQNSYFNFKSLQNLSELISLYIIDGLLSEIPRDAFPLMPKLEIVTFSNNSITTIYKEMFDNLPKIVSIDFSRNKITTIYKEMFDNLPKIKLIDFSRNKITTIGEDVFYLPNALREVTIDLNWNQIESIHRYAFRDLTFLKLNLIGNELETLDEDVFELLIEYLMYFKVKDGYIDVKDNPFKCDSSILWLVKKPFWHKPRVSNFECKHNGKILKQLKDSDLN